MNISPISLWYMANIPRIHRVYKVTNMTGGPHLARIPAAKIAWIDETMFFLTVFPNGKFTMTRGSTGHIYIYTYMHICFFW